MNKKHFLFLLPVCLVFCFSLTTCEEEVVVVTDLWDKLHDTVWVSGNNSTNTIGFYGSRKGPYGNPTGDAPYIVIRQNRTIQPPSSKLWETKGVYSFYLLQSIKIDRTGKEISSNNTFFHISVSDNGEKLTIYDVKSGGVPITQDTYSKISNNPNFDWNKITPDAVEKFFDTYRVDYFSAPSNKPNTETIHINKPYLMIEADDSDFLVFSISEWEQIDTPTEYKDYFIYSFNLITFRLTGKIIDVKPRGANLYGSKTTPGFTSADINSTECWVYLCFDYTGDEEDNRLIRTAFSKAGNLNENIITDYNNLARVYRKVDPRKPIDGIFELGDFTSYNADTQRGWCSYGTDYVATNLSINYLVSAKYLVLELDTAPTGGLQLIWQGNSDGWRWNQTDDVLDSNGNPNAAKGSILVGNKLTIELSKALKNYDDFVVVSSWAKILLGYYSPDIEGLGVIKAYLLYE